MTTPSNRKQQKRGTKTERLMAFAVKKKGNVK